VACGKGDSAVVAGTQILVQKSDPDPRIDKHAVVARLASGTGGERYRQPMPCIAQSGGRLRFNRDRLRRGRLISINAARWGSCKRFRGTEFFCGALAGEPETSTIDAPPP